MSLIEDLMSQIAVLFGQNAHGEIGLGTMSLKGSFLLAVKILLHPSQTVQKWSMIERERGKVSVGAGGSGNSCPLPPRPPKRKKETSTREPSQVWDHFQKIKGNTPSEPNPEIAICKYCSKRYGYTEANGTMTVDNASSNDGTINYLKSKTYGWKSTIMDNEFIHMKCGAHITNLIVSDGMKEVNDYILKI
ncbi:hypothetical protein RJ639_043076 [Escallonia herrerae]|uniref:BED-type domain-containing protein n=1 Tax=Escallonia herrerae TaxID=1293975 RepID=A0AA88WBR1_9ASTE|nr:hypothetical protein RJ639_043076 [Escallonia herrerae]